MTPIFRRIYNRLDQLLGRRLPPPYEAVQEYTETQLHAYLKCAPESIGVILIVGGFVADEVLRMLPLYPNAKFAIFEPSRRVIEQTRNRFAGHADRVTVVNCAVSEKSQMMRFHEANEAGSGSLLPLAEAAKQAYQLQPAEMYEVEAIRLDEWILKWEHASAAAQKIDMIWCDVQGAELQVLRGAGDLIGRTSALFLEVSLQERMYEGAALFSELIEFLKPHNFQTVLLGTDAPHATGNALLLKRDK